MMADVIDGKYRIEKLDNDNYFNWKFVMEMLLKKEHSWDAIIGEKPAEAAQLTVWNKANDSAMSTIVLSVQKSQFVHIRKTKSAKEMWNVLQQYHEKGAGNSSVQLIKEICTKKLTESDNLEEHIHWLLDMFQRIDDLGEEKLSEKWQIGLLFGQLPRSYDTIVTALQTQKTEDLSMKMVQAKLIDEYKRLIIRNCNENGDSAGDAVLKIDKRKGKCRFCHKPGHFKAECHKYTRWLQKDKVKQPLEKSEKAAAVEKSDDDMLFMTEHIESQGADDWIIDSGATCHICVNKSKFEKEIIETFNNQEKVREADGRTYSSRGTGSVKLQFFDDKGNSVSAILTNVLYIPEISSNILSVKLMAARGYEITFGTHKCSVQKKGGRRIYIGENCGSQYILKQSKEVYAAHKRTNLCVHKWHRILGHRDINVVRRLNNDNLVTGVRFEACNCSDDCEICTQGKMTRLPFPKRSLTSTNAVMDLVHTDLCGPMPTKSHGGMRYILTFIDDFSRYTVIYLLKEKSQCFMRLKEFSQMARTMFSKTIKVIRSDRGTEYKNKQVIEYLKGIGTKVEYTAAYSPEQNGVAERKNRTLIEMARCMMIEAKLDHSFWAEAVTTANFMQNRLPTKGAPKTPLEIWSGTLPILKNFKIFGKKCFVHIPKEKRRKLDIKAVEARFLGYDENSKAYRCFDVKTNKLIISRDVRFLEGEDNTVTVEIKPQVDNTTNESEQIVEAPDAVSGQEHIKRNNEGREKGTVSIPIAKNPVRCSERETKGVKSKRLIEEIENINSIITEPKTLADVLETAEKDQWFAAMHDEMKSHAENGTWEIVELPSNRKAVGCKWVFKLKANADGTVKRFKARLVAQGFTQRFGQDYDEVFAPVAKQTTFRTLLTVAGREQMQVIHLDAKTAFLNSKLEEEIYMKQPPCFETDDKSMVCRLKRSLYGLKQSARTWNMSLNKVIVDAGFYRSEADPCLYYQQIGNGRCYILIYVDDIVVACSDSNAIKRVEEILNVEFKVDSLGKIKTYIGIEVDRDINGIFNISQKSYINHVVNRFNLEGAKISKYPLKPEYQKGSLPDLLPNNAEYQQLIGSLLYVSINTRPDIAASVAILAQKTNCPNEEDWTELKRVVRYLKGTNDLKLRMGDVKCENIFFGYADASWAEDRCDRKSNSGYLFKLFGATISWSCKKQSCVSLSSTEAEFVALSEACKEAIWLRMLLNDFNVDINNSTLIYEDNQSCLALINQEGFSSRSKHIDTRRHFIKDHIKKQTI